MKKYLLTAVVFVAVVALFVGTRDSATRAAALFVMGVICGSVIRDIAWWQQLKRVWHGTEQLIDWNRVEEAASARGQHP